MPPGKPGTVFVCRVLGPAGLTSRRGCGILSPMFWYVMLMLFSPLYLFFGLVFRSEQAQLVLALYQQVLILQRQLGKRPSLVVMYRN